MNADATDESIGAHLIDKLKESAYQVQERKDLKQA